MTIKQHGGVFGRNPSFNEVEAGDGAIKLYRDASNNAVIEEFAAGYMKLVGAGSIQLFSNTGELLAKFVANGQNELYYNNLSRFKTTVGGVEVTDGDLKFADGHGIDFSATSGTGTSELFDDYEEGEWTPSITDLTNTATPGINNFGYYTKIGRTVTLSAYIQTSALNGVAGNIRIGNLPFTVANSVRARAGAGAGAGTGLNITAGHNVSIYALPNTTNLIPMVWDDAAGSTQMTATEWSDDGGIMIGLTYVAA